MTTIYYFSASGNSLKTAMDIADCLGDSEVICISKAIATDVECKSDNIGIVFPIFAGGIPNQVRRFLEKLRLTKNAYVFAVGTCGFWCGNAFYYIDELLRTKGAKLSYYTKHVMTANYIAMYDVKTHQAKKLLAKADKRLAPVIENIKAKAVCKPPKKKNLIEILFAFHGRYASADKDFIVSEACTACGICVSICPAQNISLENGKPSFKHRCEHCMGCVHWCPKEAINYTKKTVGRKRYHHPSINVGQMKLR